MLMHTFFFFFADADVVVQFYPWFNVYPMGLIYAILMMNVKQRKIDIVPRIKLNYSTYTFVR